MAKKPTDTRTEGVEYQTQAVETLSLQPFFFPNENRSILAQSLAEAERILKGEQPPYPSHNSSM